jgi:hypothetical protein
MGSGFGAGFFPGLSPGTGSSPPRRGSCCIIQSGASSANRLLMNSLIVSFLSVHTAVGDHLFTSPGHHADGSREASNLRTDEEPCTSGSDRLRQGRSRPSNQRVHSLVPPAQLAAGRNAVYRTPKRPADISAGRRALATPAVGVGVRLLDLPEDANLSCGCREDAILTALVLNRMISLERQRGRNKRLRPE